MTIPKIIFTRQWISGWVNEVMTHPNEETGCALYGVLLADGTLIINGLLKPPEGSLIRSKGEIRIGGENLKQQYLWLAQSWDWIQKDATPKVAGKFYFLDSAHSHYTLGFKQYSPTDKSRLCEAIEEGQMSIAVGVLATIENKNIMNYVVETFRSGSIMTNRQWSVRLQFYCLTRQMYESGKRDPILVTPKIVDEKETPTMPPLGWQIVREGWYKNQLRSLELMGCETLVLPKPITSGQPLALQFIIQNPSWKGIVDIITPWDFPNSLPTVTIRTNLGKSQKDIPPQYRNLVDIIVQLREKGEL